MAPHAEPGPQTSPQRWRAGEPPCGVDGTRRPTARRQAHRGDGLRGRANRACMAATPSTRPKQSTSRRGTRRRWPSGSVGLRVCKDPHGVCRCIAAACAVAGVSRLEDRPRGSAHRACPRRKPPDRGPIADRRAGPAMRPDPQDYRRCVSRRSSWCGSGRCRSSSQALHSAVTASRKARTLAAIASRSSISMAYWGA